MWLLITPVDFRWSASHSRLFPHTLGCRLLWFPLTLFAHCLQDAAAELNDLILDEEPETSEFAIQVRVKEGSVSTCIMPSACELHCMCQLRGPGILS